MTSIYKTCFILEQRKTLYSGHHFLIIKYLIFGDPFHIETELELRPTGPAPTGRGSIQVWPPSASAVPTGHHQPSSLFKTTASVHVRLEASVYQAHCRSCENEDRGQTRQDLEDLPGTGIKLVCCLFLSQMLDIMSSQEQPPYHHTQIKIINLQTCHLANSHGFESIYFFVPIYSEASCSLASSLIASLRSRSILISPPTLMLLGSVAITFSSLLK